MTFTSYYSLHKGLPLRKVIAPCTKLFCMSFPQPPMELEKWNISILNELIKHSEIESERFDFKDRRMGDLAQDICAMANTIGGLLVLGIGQNEKNGKLIEFLKDGWDNGDQDAVNTSIGNHVARIEPIPKIRLHVLPDTDGKFYMILKVEPVVRDRPYIIKGSGASYIRIGNGSHPAGRDVIISLCRQTIERTTSVGNLATFSAMLRELLSHIDNLATTVNQRQDATAYFIPEIDTSTFRQVSAATMWFLSENDLITANLVPGPERRHGLYSTINHLEELNGAIRRFNLDFGSQRGQHFSRYYQGGWKPKNLQWVVKYFERVEEAAKEFLSQTG